MRETVTSVVGMQHANGHRSDVISLSSDQVLVDKALPSQRRVHAMPPLPHLL